MRGSAPKIPARAGREEGRRFFRRSLVALGIAAMLPTVVFAAFSVFHLMRVERERVELDALASSRTLMSLADAQLERHFAALEVLSTSIYFATENWGEFYLRVQRQLAVHPLWQTVVVMDARHGYELFDLRRPFGTPVPITATHRDYVNQLLRTAARAIGNVDSHEHPAVWIYLPVVDQGTTKFVIAAAIEPRIFQELLTSFAAPGSTAGIVDRNGNFVARTLDYEQRVGTPATAYVRNAIRSGRGGLYRGTTYEGLKNYSAYHVSKFSGWSAHLAVASASIDTPRRWSFVAAGSAALGGVLLGGFLIVLVLRDMAERRRAEEMLRQSQKMEAIGQLTGGIAHDFNNLLTAIIGNLDMIRTRAAGNERLQRSADNALEAARRGAKLASQLLAFSRSQRLHVRPVDLQQLLGGMSGLLSQSLGPAVQVRMHIDENARFVVSDANQLELALLNLAVNARDAMPDGGLLTITARRATNVDRALPQGDYVELRVDDTGTGMSQEVQARAVEPFYTTKPIGQGTGLGLSQVYGVVRESGGVLAIDSATGRGTSVRLTLPAAAALIDDVPQVAPPAPACAADRPLRVLVVDDDRLVRRFMSETLRNLKYEVTDAENGEQALPLLEQARFDLLLVDFAMPGINGAEVARAAQSSHPGLKVLVVSGYADSAAVEAALGSAARQLRKPFNMAELGDAVAETLRAPSEQQP